MGKVAIENTDMDIYKAIKDFFVGFDDEISLSESIKYAANQLGFEKVEDYERSGAMQIIQGRDFFMANPTSSGKSLMIWLFTCLLFTQVHLTCLLKTVKSLKDPRKPMLYSS